MYVSIIHLWSFLCAGHLTFNNAWHYNLSFLIIISFFLTEDEGTIEREGDRKRERERERVRNKKRQIHRAGKTNNLFICN